MNNDHINEKTIICRSETLLSNNLGEDIVMMDIEEGAYYGLEEVAARIWEMAENPVSVGSLCENLMNEYKVSKEECRSDVGEFLEDLLDRKILKVVH